MYETIIQKNIPKFTQSKDTIWTDPYISKQLLKAHLDEEHPGATRPLDVVKGSIAWLQRSFPKEEFPKVVDLGCGPGIYAERLAASGYQVSGLDFSKRSIDYGKQHRRSLVNPVSYYLLDYLKQSLPVTEQDLALLIYCDLGVFSNQDRRKIIRKVYQSLTPGGVFIFDVFTPQKYQGFSATKDWQIEKENFWSQEACLHLESHDQIADSQTYLDQHYLLYPNDYKEFFVWETVFSRQEIERELQAVGFKQITVYGDFTGKTYYPTSETLCFVAQK